VRIADHISSNSSTLFLAQVLRMAGPAGPQQSPQQQNAQGWATLVPINQDDGSPFKMENGLNQYFPDWNRQVDDLVGTSLRTLIPRVKDDVNLGTDITNLSPDAN